MERLARSFIIFIAQGAYSGRLPVAPGTAGTLVGVLLYLGMKGLPVPVYAALCVLIFFIGMWIAGRAEALLGRTDHPSIVIDEIAGYLVAMVLVPSGWSSIAVAFVLFRVFDIVKPFPLKRLQNLHGGPGVMLDDIGAGVYTNVVLQIAWFLFRRG
jgi:phosphatidylglycerophosphatase A